MSLEWPGALSKILICSDKCEIVHVSMFKVCNIWQKWRQSICKKSTSSLSEKKFAKRGLMKSSSHSSTASCMFHSHLSKGSYCKRYHIVSYFIFRFCFSVLGQTLQKTKIHDLWYIKLSWAMVPFFVRFLNLYYCIIFIYQLWRWRN